LLGVSAYGGTERMPARGATSATAASVLVLFE
jgi:hypothetical protein